MPAFFWKKHQGFLAKLYLYSKQVIINKNLSFTECASGIRFPDRFKLATNWKTDIDVKISDINSSSIFFDFVSDFFYKGFTRNSKIGKKPVGVLPNIWRQGRLKNKKFRTNVFNTMLLNSAKCQGYNFYRFWAIKGKPIGE